MAERIPQSTSIRVPLHAVLSSDHASPATGKTITVTISKNGAAFASPAAGTTHASEIGSGAYYVDLTAADTSTLGPLVLVGTATSTDNVVVLFDVVPASQVPNFDVPTIGLSGTSFLTPVDIANRALQHCGATRIDVAQGFSEDSKNASETAFAYNKLREAELRRNIWRFAIREAVLRAIDSSTRLLAPSLWVSSTTYFVGSIVADERGTLWISRQPNNAGNDPLLTSAWEQYFGPMTVSPYDSTSSYRAGELVYTTAGDGTSRVYLSLINGNSDNPATATAWSATTTYTKNQVVAKSSTAYMSLIDFNLNQDPATKFVAEWATGTTYALGNKVTGSDGVVYQSVGNGNIAHDPTTNGGVNWTNTGVLSPWDTTFVAGTGSLNWLQIGGAEFPTGVALATLNIVYPLGSGPTTQSTTRNVFRLPANFLRKAPRDPKAGATSYLGAPGGMFYDDWNFEGNYIVSSETGAIVLRFVANMVDVTQMDAMFCEGLAARVAIAVCEPLTQSGSKLSTIASEYAKFMSEARAVNAIETGSEQPPLDDYLACRY